MTNEDILITFFQNKLKSSKTNEVNIGANDISTIGLSEQEIIQTIFLLQEDSIVSIKRKSIHNDFSMYWTIALKSKCVHYFDDKKNKSVANRRERIRTYVPITLSAIAIIISILSLAVKLT